MNKKLTLSFVSALVATSAMASVVTYDPDNTPTKITGDALVKLSVPTGVEEAVFDGAGRTDLYYVIMNTANPNEDADITIVNGFSAVRNGTGEILTFKQAAAGAGKDAVMTLKQGTYNFATSDLSELIITAQTSAADINDTTRAIVFDADTTSNIFTSTARFQGINGAKIVSKGNMNIYNTAYTTAVPSNVAYGQLYTIGTFIQESGTITANDLLVESVNARFNGTLNLKQAVASGSHYPIDIKDAKSLTLGADAKVTTTAGSRIRLGSNSTLTVESGEKSIQADLILIKGSNAKLNLAGKNSFVHTNGKFETTLLSYTGKDNIRIAVSETNTFGATFFAASDNWKETNESVKFYIDFDFTSDDQYLNLGKIYTGDTCTGIDPVFYVKDFQNGYLRATEIVKDGSVATVGDTKLYIFNEASQTYEFVESMWVGDATNGYILTIAVPEPAEWAMLFGAIALGFAIYRRRK